jgi:hypothetical protein
LTTLVVEILALSVNEPTLVPKVEIYPGFVVITRGAKKVAAADFMLSQHTTVLGRKFVEVMMPSAEVAVPVEGSIASVRSLTDVLDESIDRFVKAEQKSLLLSRSAELSDQREAAYLASEKHSLELTRLLEERSAQLVALSRDYENLSRLHASAVTGNRELTASVQAADSALLAAREAPLEFAMKVLLRKHFTSLKRLVRRLIG